ncbi:MAG: proline hydroxylase [Leptolyngbyaceae cyanobacterium CSU_1_4]|nr:proline hydroxylase [Leptolyngbyaceae cyanobacterium CSU_1_4]
MPTKRSFLPKPPAKQQSAKRQSGDRSVIPLQSSLKTCQVTLLLTAGHQYHLALQPDHPLLSQLFQVMLAKSQAIASRSSQGVVVPPDLLQIPNGQTSLCISSADIIGIVTEPALFISTQSASVPETHPGNIPLNVPASSSLAPALSPDSSLFLPTQCFQLDNFLNPTDHAAALHTALSQEANFIRSTTTTAADNYRQSAILYATLYPDLYHLLSQKIMTLLPTILRQLKMPAFEISEVEMQMTAHNDGCFYKVHNDSGDVPTVTRQLTYVYYFCQEPQAFSGGELKIYDTELKNGGQKELEPCKIVTPRNNSIVFFDSRLMHEVLPVQCSSRAFSHSRFTLNGWLRRVP